MFRAELLRIRRSRALFFVLAGLLALVCFARFEGARIPAQMASGLARETSPSSSDNLEQSATEAQVRIAKSLYSPPGALATVAGLMSSALGLALGAALGAWGLGVEFGYGTIRYVALRNPRRSQLLAAKFAAVCVTVICTAVVLTALLFVVDAYSGRGFRLVHRQGLPLRVLLNLNPGQWIVSALLTVVLGFALAILGVVLARSLFGGVVGAGGVVVADLVVSKASHWFLPWSLSYNVWSMSHALT